MAVALGGGRGKPVLKSVQNSTQDYADFVFEAFHFQVISM